MKIMATSFKRSHACTATLTVPNPAAGHHQPKPLLETPGHSWASLGQSLVESLLPSPGSSCAQSFVCALHMSVSPVLCKFWQFCGVSNGDLLQQGLCHTQVYCTQSPCPCISPLQETLKHSSVSVSVGSLGPGAHKVCLSPVGISASLILNTNSCLLPSFWGFSFALGCGVSPQSHASAEQPPLQRLPPCWGFSTVKVTQSCVTLCDPIHYTVHRILQDRILE